MRNEGKNAHFGNLLWRKEEVGGGDYQMGAGGGAPGRGFNSEKRDRRGGLMGSTQRALEGLRVPDNEDLGVLARHAGAADLKQVMSGTLHHPTSK